MLACGSIADTALAYAYHTASSTVAPGPCWDVVKAFEIRSLQATYLLKYFKSSALFALLWNDSNVILEMIS